MTLKDLFRSVEFDEILPYIIDYDPEIADSVLSLKQAFDSIRIIEPCEDKSNETICVSYFNDTDATNGFSVRNCSNDSFATVAGRHIETAPNINLTLNELAAYCLWELTYWGFSDEDSMAFFQISTICGGIEQKNRFQKEYIEKSNRWSSVSVSPYTFREKPKNRQKRMREYRREKRLRQLLRYAKIEELCQYISEHNVSGIIPDDLWSLKDVAGFTVATDRSFSAKTELAEQYMCELYEKYGHHNHDTVRSIGIITGGCSVDSKLDRLKATLAKFLPNAVIGIGDRRETQIKIIIISVLSTAQAKRQKT